MKTQLRYSTEIVVAFMPWIASMFALYWLEYGEIWTTDTPHRGKASVAILIAGMSLSFLLHSRFAKRKQNSTRMNS